MAGSMSARRSTPVPAAVEGQANTTAAFQLFNAARFNLHEDDFQPVFNRNARSSAAVKVFRPKSAAAVRSTSGASVAGAIRSGAASVEPSRTFLTETPHVPSHAVPQPPKRPKSAAAVARPQRPATASGTAHRSVTVADDDDDDDDGDGDANDREARAITARRRPASAAATARAASSAAASCASLGGGSGSGFNFSSLAADIKRVLAEEKSAAAEPDYMPSRSVSAWGEHIITDNATAQASAAHARARAQSARIQRPPAAPTAAAAATNSVVIPRPPTGGGGGSQTQRPASGRAAIRRATVAVMPAPEGLSRPPSAPPQQFATTAVASNNELSFVRDRTFSVKAKDNARRRSASDWAMNVITDRIEAHRQRQEQTAREQQIAAVVAAAAAEQERLRAEAMADAEAAAAGSGGGAEESDRDDANSFEPGNAFDDDIEDVKSNDSDTERAPAPSVVPAATQPAIAPVAAVPKAPAPVVISGPTPEEMPSAIIGPVPAPAPAPALVSARKAVPPTAQNGFAVFAHARIMSAVPDDLVTATDGSVTTSTKPKPPPAARVNIGGSAEKPSAMATITTLAHHPQESVRDEHGVKRPVVTKIDLSVVPKPELHTAHKLKTAYLSHRRNGWGANEPVLFHQLCAYDYYQSQSAHSSRATPHLVNHQLLESFPAPPRYSLDTRRLRVVAAERAKREAKEAAAKQKALSANRIFPAWLWDRRDFSTQRDLSQTDYCLQVLDSFPDERTPIHLRKLKEWILRPPPPPPTAAELAAAESANARPASAPAPPHPFERRGSITQPSFMRQILKNKPTPNPTREQTQSRRQRMKEHDELRRAEQAKKKERAAAARQTRARHSLHHHQHLKGGHSDDDADDAASDGFDDDESALARKQHKPAKVPQRSARIEYLNSLPRDFLQSILRVLKIVRIRAGKYIYKSGASDDKFYMIHSGTVQKLQIDSGASSGGVSGEEETKTAAGTGTEEVVTQTLTAGATFGHELVHDDKMRAKPAKPKRNISKLWDAARRRSMLFNEQQRKIVTAADSRLVDEPSSSDDDDSSTATGGAGSSGGGSGGFGNSLASVVAAAANAASDPSRRIRRHSMRALTDVHLITLGFDEFLSAEHKYLNTTQHESIKFLASLPLFKLWDYRRLRQLYALLPSQIYPKGSTIWRQGSYGDCLAFIVSGSVSLSRECTATEIRRWPVTPTEWRSSTVVRPFHVVVAHATTKSHIGEEVLTQTLKREFTVRCQSEVKVLLLDKTCLAALTPKDVSILKGEFAALKVTVAQIIQRALIERYPISHAKRAFPVDPKWLSTVFPPADVDTSTDPGCVRIDYYPKLKPTVVRRHAHGKHGHHHSPHGRHAAASVAEPPQTAATAGFSPSHHSLLPISPLAVRRAWKLNLSKMFARGGGRTVTAPGTGPAAAGETTEDRVARFRAAASASMARRGFSNNTPTRAPARAPADSNADADAGGDENDSGDERKEDAVPAPAVGSLFEPNDDDEEEDEDDNNDDGSKEGNDDAADGGSDDGDAGDADQPREPSEAAEATVRAQSTTAPAPAGAMSHTSSQASLGNWARDD